MKREMKRKLVKLTVNGEAHKLYVEPHKTLLEVLRDDLNLTGTKYGCGTGECGACTVIVDEKLVLACLTLAIAVDGKNILTIEGLTPPGKPLSIIQEMFVEYGAIQCGFCTPGMVMSAKALLDENPNPAEQEVREFIGNLCRCTGYVKIVEAILAAVKKIKGEKIG